MLESTEAPYQFGQDTNTNLLQKEMGLFAQGGQVPQMDQNTLIGLAILSQMQQQQETAYSGTPLEEEKQQSTISEMFASQGKTLGGNNTQSLSQILGR